MIRVLSFSQTLHYRTLYPVMAFKGNQKDQERGLFMESLSSRSRGSKDKLFIPFIKTISHQSGTMFQLPVQ